MKIFWRCLVVGSLTLIGMCVAVVLVNAIPNDRILANVRSSISVTDFPPSQAGLANFAAWDDCTAATIGLGPTGKGMPLINRSFLSPVVESCDKFQKYLSGAPNQGMNYWRYWHGSQLLSRPILFRYGLGMVHWVSFSLFVLCGLFFGSQVSRFTGAGAWSLAFAFLCVPIAEQTGVLSHSMVWMVAFLGGGILLVPDGRASEDYRDPHVWFLVLGMLCCFFDFLTVPIVTLAVPLLGLYWRGGVIPGSPKLTVGRILIFSALWAAGYSICWTTKWIIVAALGEPSVMNEILKIIKHRLGTAGGPLGDRGEALSVSATRSILDNARWCRHGLILLAVVALIRARVLVPRLDSVWRWSLSAAARPALVIFAMPFVWLATVQQHSIVHSWFVAPVYFCDFALLFMVILAPGCPAESPALSDNSGLK